MIFSSLFISSHLISFCFVSFHFIPFSQPIAPTGLLIEPIGPTEPIERIELLGVGCILGAMELLLQLYLAFSGGSYTARRKDIKKRRKVKSFFPLCFSFATLASTIAAAADAKH